MNGKIGTSLNCQEKNVKKGFNKEESFIVRCKEDINGRVFILSVKYNKHTKETQASQIKHVDDDEKGKCFMCEKKL